MFLSHSARIIVFRTLIFLCLWNFSLATIFHILGLYCKSGSPPGSIIKTFVTNREFICYTLCSRDKGCFAATYSSDRRCFHHSSLITSCTTPTAKVYKVYNKIAVSDCYHNGNYNIWNRKCLCNTGFYGKFCQNDGCNPNPCTNFGSCVRTSDSQHFRCLCVGGFSGTTCAINNGIQISDELTHSNTLQFGDWKGYKYCSHGYFVNGIQLRVDPAGGDDTALNNVRLECKRPYDNTTGTSVKSGTAQDGVWYGTSYCPDGMYMVAFVVRLLPYKGPFSDDYGATDFKFRCRSYLNPHEATIDLHPPGGLTKGDWGSWSSSCNANSAVCGVESKIEISSSLDKTGLNVVRFKCCSY